MISSVSFTQAPPVIKPLELNLTGLELQPALNDSDWLNRFSCTAARLLVRLSLWLCVLAIAKKGAGWRQAVSRMLAAFALGAVSGCATLLGTSRLLLRRIGS